MAEMGNPVRLLIYGGIGSGKSTVTEFLSDLGAKIIEADKLGHEVLEPSGEAFAEVSARWPQVVEGGKINRSKLGAVVFADPDALQELESLTHPHIRSRIQAIVTESANEHLVLEMPILRAFVGDGWVKVLIDAPLAARIERVVARDSDPEDAMARAAAQPSDAEYHEAADWVVANTGELDDLRAAVGELWAQLQAA